ncbi:MAG: hypothetical protein LBH07_04450, partial [Treponema sp.]|nr:hypothetical protein [Treponema sp.]
MENRQSFQTKALSGAGIALAGAAVSVACFRTGYFIFFFLLPLALAAFFGEARTAWTAGIFATALNAIVSIGFYFHLGANPGLLLWNALYYSTMVMTFTWINAPPGTSRGTPGRFWFFNEIPYRMIAGAVICVLFLSPIFLSIVNDPELKFLIIGQLENLGSAVEFSGPTSEEILSRLVYVGLRGGILLSCLVFWWINRQFGLLITRFIRREHTKESGKLISFRTPFFFVWVFSFSLGAVVLGRAAHLDPVEIGGWNILVLSAILFLVQGGSIVLHFLARLSSLPRILISVG